MTLVKFRNQHPAATTPFSTLFNEFFNGGQADLRHREMASHNTPAVNVKESPEKFEIEVAAPGFSKENFKLNLNANLLTISGSKEETAADASTAEKARYTRREWQYSQFERSFTLPNSIATEAIGASYENGVLHIVLPKRDEAKEKPARAIEIK